MKTVLLITALIVGLFTPAGAETASEATVLASVSMSIEGAKPETIILEKILRQDEIFLTARVGTEPPFWTSEPLGSEDKKFQFDNKPSTLVLADFNSDKKPEILTAAFYGPKASGLYVFTFHAEKRQLIPVSCHYPNPEDNRDLLVSDLHQDDGSDFVVGKDGNVRILGLIYSTEEGAEPTPGHFSYTFKDGHFEAGKTEPVPSSGK